MDTDLGTLRQNAYNATQGVADMQTSAPGLLRELKQNLVGIFAKDNPIIDARNNALSDYLSTASATRASLLPENMQMVEGRPLTLSPTQQNAIVTGRNAAALAPLAGYNEILKGMYGTIGDMVSGAGDIYQASIQGAQTGAKGLMDLYQAALEEEKMRQSAASNGGIDLPSILAAISSALNVQAPSGPSLDDIFSMNGNDPMAIPQGPTPEQLGFNPKTYKVAPPAPLTPSMNNALKNMKITPQKPANPNALSLPGQSNPYSSLQGLGLNIRL